MFKNLRKKVTDDFGQPSLPTPIQRMYHGDHDSASEMSSIADPGTMSKQEILALYQRSCTKYNKYKGRYSDLIRSFRTLEADHKRLQDERRSQQRCVSELREQCHLEQQAKAHMEDTLRTDLEERDETIRLLRLKVQLVHDGNNSTSSHVPPSAETHGDGQLVVLHTDEEEVTSIKDKLERRERLLLECQDRLKQGESRSSSLLNDKHQLQQRLTENQHTTNAERESHKSELSRLESLVCELRQRMASSQQQQLNTVENQTVLQQDMQRKDGQLQQLRRELEDKRAAVDRLDQQVTGLNTELNNTRADNRKALHELERVSEEEKASLVQELSRGKQEALRVLETELESRLADEWGRRLQLREDQLVAEIRDCREQLHLAAEEQQLQQTAASSSQQLHADRRQLTTALDSLRVEKSSLESRVSQLEATHAAALEQCRRQADHQLQELRTRAEAAEAKQQQLTMQMAAEAEDAKLKAEKMNQEVDNAIEGSADSKQETEAARVTLARQHSDEISSLREEHEAVTAELLRQLAASEAVGGSCEVDSGNRPAVSTEQHHAEAESIGAEAAAEVERLQVEGVRLQEQIVMLKQQLEERLQERMRMVEEHQSELEQLRTARTELDDALMTARSDLDTTGKRCSDLEDQVMSLKASGNDLQSHLSTAGQNEQDLQARLSAAEDQRQLQMLKEEREEMGKRLESAEAERQRLHADLSRMMDERYQIQSELVASGNEKKGLQSCLESAEKELEQLQQRLISEENDKQQVLTRALAAEDNANLLRLQLASMENGRKELQKALDTVEEFRNQLQDLLKAAEDEVTEQRAKLAEAEESLSALKNCDAGKSEEVSRLIASLEEARESEACARSDADSRSQELGRAGVELERVLVEASATQQRLSELGSQLTSAQSEVADTGKHAAGLTGQLSAALAAAEDAGQQLQTAAVQQQQLEERLAEKQRQFAAATASAQQLEQRLERQLVDRQEAARQAEQCQLQMRNAQNELATVQTARHGLESESHRLRDELAELSVTRTHLERDLADWKQKLHAAEDERERLEARVEALTADLQEAEQGLETALRSRGHMEGRLEQLEQLAEQSSRWHTERDQLEARVAELEEWNIPETEQWAEERHLLQARFEQLQRDHEEAEQQRDSLSKTVEELQLLQQEGIVRRNEMTAMEKLPRRSASPTLGNNTDYGAGERLTLSSPSPPFDGGAFVDMLDSCGDHMTAGAGEHAVSTTEGGDSGAGEGGMAASSSTAAVSECQWTSMQRRVAHQKQEIRRLTNQLSQTNSTHVCEVSELRRLLELGQQKHSARASSTSSSPSTPTAVLNSHADDGDDVATLHPVVEGAGSSDPHFLTELEYLRNILYEYMMGKEPVTLAKVIAAVVKFDDDQTRLVLEREQTRQSALSNSSSVGSTLYSISPFKWR